MKIYKTQAEVDADLNAHGDLILDCHVKFEFSVKIKRNINARDINARDINAWNINAWNINARDINAWNINAGDINAGDINAWNINARDISFFAFCVAYISVKCKSWTAKREKHLPPQCIEGTLTVDGNVTEVRCG